MMTQKHLLDNFFNAAVRCALGSAAILVLAESASAQTGSATNKASSGFVDLHAGVADSVQSGNLILRTPLFVGGVSYDAFDGASDLFGFGALARPLGESPGSGELILGASYLDRAGAEKWEAQASYVDPHGIGIGAGFAGGDGADIWFIKATARGRRGALFYQASALAQTSGGRTSPGGYIAVYTDHVFVGAGRDGEQWRVLGALSANNGPGSPLDPSVEILYVDNSDGRTAGEKFLFVNGSLRRNRGFLNTPSRLGRALAPQGLQFANPVSFVSQPWSRTIDVWELGEIMNVRFTRREVPGGGASTLAQTVVFPVQAFGGDSVLRGLFAGYERKHDGARSDSLLFGHAGRLGALWITAAGSLDVGNGVVSGAFGIKLLL